MNLRYLRSTPNVHVYFDSWHNWLYLEWKGELTLPATQPACLAITHCFVANAYPRVLNDNTHLARAEWDVAPWLAQHFLPYLSLAGVQQLAWVHGSGPRAQELAAHVLRHLGPQVNAALFADTEEAVGWLQRVRPSYVSGCELLPRPVPRDTKLEHLLNTFEQEVAATHAAPAPPGPAEAACSLLTP